MKNYLFYSKNNIYNEILLNFYDFQKDDKWEVVDVSDTKKCERLLQGNKVKYVPMAIINNGNPFDRKVLTGGDKIIKWLLDNCNAHLNSAFHYKNESEKIQNDFYNFSKDDADAFYILHIEPKIKEASGKGETSTSLKIPGPSTSPNFELIDYLKKLHFNVNYRNLDSRYIISWDVELPKGLPIKRHYAESYITK